METKVVCTHCDARFTITLREDAPAGMQLAERRCPACERRTLIRERGAAERRAETERLGGAR